MYLWVYTGPLPVCLLLTSPPRDLFLQLLQSLFERQDSLRVELAESLRCEGEDLLRQWSKWQDHFPVLDLKQSELSLFRVLSEALSSPREQDPSSLEAFSLSQGPPPVDVVCADCCSPLFVLFFCESFTVSHNQLPPLLYSVVVLFFCVFVSKHEKCPQCPGGVLCVWFACCCFLPLCSGSWWSYSVQTVRPSCGHVCTCVRCSASKIGFTVWRQRSYRTVQTPNCLECFPPTTFRFTLHLDCPVFVLRVLVVTLLFSFLQFTFATLFLPSLAFPNSVPDSLL